MTAGDSHERLDDDDYPAYTMGRAAEMLGTTQGFLRAIGEAGLITPLRSAAPALASASRSPGAQVRRHRPIVAGQGANIPGLHFTS